MPRYTLVVSFLWMFAFANSQQFPYQRDDDLNPKGVCTINGKVYYGIDCWCYSGGLGTALVATFTITLIIFFFISGCIWACIFKCLKAIRGGRDDEGFETGMHSLRSSMRSSMQKRTPDSTI